MGLPDGLSERERQAILLRLAALDRRGAGLSKLVSYFDDSTEANKRRIDERLERLEARVAAIAPRQQGRAIDTED